MTSIYFAGVMVRLMLVLAPVMCILSAIGISAILVSYMKNLDSFTSKQDKKTKKIEDNYPKKSEVIREKYVRKHQIKPFLRFLFLIIDRFDYYIFHVFLAGHLYISLHVGHVRSLLESLHSLVGQRPRR